jgi:hypothetical protein
MGMYTELIFGASLKKDTPKEVIDILQYLMKPTKKDKEKLTIPDHPFFSCDRWRMIFTCSSFYFGVNESVRKMWFEEIGYQWRISTRSNLKNYDSEIEKFLDWIKPYIESGSGWNEFYAIVCYEEARKPTIYYLFEED